MLGFGVGNLDRHSVGQIRIQIAFITSQKERSRGQIHLQRHFLDDLLTVLPLTQFFFCEMEAIELQIPEEF